MSSCAASSCICSPRASFVSVTSASLPTGDAPRSCRYASQHSAQSHRRSKQKPLSPRNPTLFGFAPSVADRWRSSNDLLLLNSNSVLHQCWSLLRHETARPQLETSARFTAPRPRPPYSRHDSYAAPSFPLFSTSILAPTRSRAPSSASVPTPVNFNTPPSLHSI